ncbi:hypothetical protein ADK67_29145 [Saccharothrix sp. NRRL B-16348]|nr:hypothetical protein ADK67_29145 [Saccharothrix sp. NRRL B-16348]
MGGLRTGGADRVTGGPRLTHTTGGRPVGCAGSGRGTPGPQSGVDGSADEKPVGVEHRSG